MVVTVDPAALKAELGEQARRLGFAACGVTSARPFTEARTRALAAIDAGRMDGMPWYTRERVEASADIGGRYPWARSIVALAWPYPPARPPDVDTPPSATAPIRGRFAAYACIHDGERIVDYHDLLARGCDALVTWLRTRVDGVTAKRFVDHGWALDRAIAERAGIGFAGKHASLLTTEAGSYVMLAGIAVSVALPADAPSRRDCGQCRACIPACPTGAITAPGVIDARRCISYLTIEHRGAIPLELRPLMGTWAFGCDLCQEACPINHRLAPQPLDDTTTTTRNGPVPHPDLVECLELGEASFAARFRRTAVWRTGRAGLARNCAIALGNAGNPAALNALRRSAEHDPDPVVRDAANWSIARLTGQARSSGGSADEARGEVSGRAAPQRPRR
jgi:epoxyqueuosine reductase